MFPGIQTRSEICDFATDLLHCNGIVAWTNTIEAVNNPANFMAQNAFFGEFDAQMRRGGCSDAAIRAFRHSYDSLAAGNSGLIPESGIQPVATLPDFDDTTRQSRDGALLAVHTIWRVYSAI